MKFLEKILSLCLYLLAFLLPLQTRWIVRPGSLNGGYFEYGTISVYGTDVLLVLVICSYLFYLRQKHKTQNTNPKQNTARLPARQEYKSQTNKLYLLIIGLNIISLISIFFAANRLVSVQAYVRLTLGMSLFFIVAVAAYDRLKLIYAFLAGAAIQALLGIWQFLTQTTFASKWLGLAAHPSGAGGTSVIESFGGGRWLRAYGGLDHPNMLGGLMVVAILVGLFLLIRKGEQKISKTQDTRDNDQTNHNFQITNRLYSFVNWKLDIENCLLLVSCILFLTALFFTFSRGAWLGLIVGLIVILAINLGIKNHNGLRTLLFLGFASVALASVLFFAYQDLIITRISGNSRLEIKSNQERTASYRDAAVIIKKNWLVGVGIGGYTPALAKTYPNQPSWFYQPTHDIFLLVLAEIGVIGLILFVAILGYALIFNFQFSRLPSASPKANGGQAIFNNFSIFNLPILFTLIILMLPDHYLWSLHFGVLLFWFLLGLAAKNQAEPG